MRRAIVVLALLCSVAHADKVKVKVVEVQGDVAYVEPGEAAGIAVGATITIGGDSLTVIAVSKDSASVRLGNAHVAVGDRGVVTAAAAGAVATAKTLPRPHKLEDFRDQWPATVMPSSQQRPQTVALGAGRAPGKLRLVAWSQLFVGARTGKVDGELDVGTRLSYTPYRERPLGLDLDVTARANQRLQSPLRVAAADVRWGPVEDPRFAVGRLRWASAATGTLDGARVATHVGGGVELAAFGGLVPNALDGRPDPSASRFGVELGWDHDRGAWPTHADLTAQGSTWQGGIDERRLTGQLEVEHGSVTADGFAEAQMFAPGNPWNAKSIELTSAGGELGWRKRGRHLALGATFLRPELSLRLQATLPQDLLCTRVPLPGAVPEQCAGGDYDATANGSAGIEGRAWSLDGGGEVGVHHGVTRDTDASGFALATVRIPAARLLFGASGGHVAAVDWEAGEAGIGFAPGHRATLSLRYRLELLAYPTSASLVKTHEALADGTWAVRRTLNASWQLAVTKGDRDAVIGLVTLIWRPYP